MTESPMPPAFELRGGLQPMTVLHLMSADLQRIEALLQEKFAQAPALLKHAPVIIDLQIVNETAQAVDVPGIIQTIRDREMVPVALRHTTPEQTAQATGWGIGVLSAERPRTNQRPQPQQPQTPVEASRPSETKVVSQPVRSGQQIYAAGQLVILAPVSAGAEVIADGNIHVYGPMRGRAIAGAKGDENARIFCEQFDGELVAIAGCYQVRETMEDTYIGKRVQLQLRDNSIAFDTF